MDAEKSREASRRYYHKIKTLPEKWERRTEKRQKWYSENKELILEKQRLRKRERKLEAIEYLGGKCLQCNEVFHPAVFEFHHRNPNEKDREPSKMLSLSWEKVKEELDKCDLLCANCHRLVHHQWENNNGI